jgi:hypothetical protein
MRKGRPRFAGCIIPAIHLLTGAVANKADPSSYTGSRICFICDQGLGIVLPGLGLEVDDRLLSYAQASVIADV